MSDNGSLQVLESGCYVGRGALKLGVTAADFVY